MSADAVASAPRRRGRSRGGACGCRRRAARCRRAALLVRAAGRACRRRRVLTGPERRGRRAPRRRSAPSATAAGRRAVAAASPTAAAAGVGDGVGQGGAASPRLRHPSGSTRIGVPTSTVLPSSTSSSETTPSNGARQLDERLRRLDLDEHLVEADACRRGRRCHCTISASVRPSPTSGRGNRISLICRLPSRSIMPWSACQYASARSTASSTRSGLGRYSVSSAAGGNGVSKPRHAQHGRLERVEGALGDRRGDLGADRARSRTPPAPRRAGRCCLTESSSGP